MSDKELPAAAEKPQSDLSELSGSAVFPYGKNTLELNWSVKDFRVTIEPTHAYNKLNEHDRLQLFNKILAPVRKRSEHELFGAALVITESGQIFVSNNAQRQHEFHKDCAEINAVNIVTQLMGTKEKIAHLYLMIGSTTPDKYTPKEALELLYAPCGKCLDALCGCSTKEAMVTLIPANDGTLPLALNTTAHHVEEPVAGEAWTTRLSTLLIDSKVSLTDKEKEHAATGWRALTGEPLPVVQLSEVEVGRLMHSRKSKQHPDQTRLRALIIQAAKNAGMRRESEPALDVDHSPSGINRFMFERISDAYHRRAPIEGKQGEHNAEAIRCVVVRLADGSFHTETEVEGPEENAVTHTEITAVASTRHLHQPITDVWVMRVNCKNPQEGTLNTSPKEGLERLFKRRAKLGVTAKDINGEPLNGSINVNYIPFNDGTLNDEDVGLINHPYRIENIYSSRWRGSRDYTATKAGSDADTRAR